MKTGDSHFADVLRQYVSQSGYMAGQLARLSGIPKMTIVHWLRGEVKRPRHWLEVVRLARALHLDAAEADSLLQAAGRPGISQLYARCVHADDRALFTAWIEYEHSGSARAPFQVIPDLGTFVGREAIGQTLTQELSAVTHETFYVLVGMAGVGKTVLAARLAYRLRPHFPDGVLWARLEGGNPMTVLQLFAQAYGRDLSEYGDLHSRSQAVRELLANKRALMVLDSVQASDQVQPLLSQFAQEQRGDRG